MLRDLLCFVLCFAVAVMPVCAEDMFGDLANAPQDRSFSSNRTPSDILDDIEAILENIYSSSNSRYTIKVTAGTNDDHEFKSMYETANGNLKALWNEFHVALKADMKNAASDKDRAFAKAVDSAMEDYKGNFGGNEGDLLREFSKIKDLVSGRSYTLRYNKSYFDKYVEMSDHVVRVSSNDPTQWDSSEVVYLAGLLPSDLIKDMNMTIKSSYLYGYMNQSAVRGLSISAISHYSSLRATDLSWDSYIDDGYYYDNIYGSTYLISDLTTTFKGMTTRSGNSSRYIEACKQALIKMTNAEERARKFKDDNDLSRDSKGRIEFTGSKSDWSKTSSAYQDICSDMQVAMKDFSVNWSNFVKSFPGAETSKFQRAMNQAFSSYHDDFVYEPVDSLDARYQSLRTKSGQFKLERVTSSMFTGASDMSLMVPSSFRKPRKALYSAQRVISFLPPDIRTVLDSRRQRAYQNGASAAEAEYRRALDQLERERAAAAAQNNSGSSDWNDNNSGSDWNNNNSNNNSGSDWNNNNSNNTENNSWNDENSNSGSDWNNNSGSNTNTNTGGSDWNTGDATDNNDNSSWSDDNTGSSDTGW